MAMISNQKSGDDSTNLQAGRDIVVNAGNSIALYSIEEVAKQLMGSVFNELPDETKRQIETNQKSYFQALSENLGKIIKQNNELKKVIDSPDFQYISKQATISASRSSSIELHKNLSFLLIQRVNNDNEDLKRIVYNEAIETLAKLTQNELKILTLCFLLKRTKFNSLINFKQFIQYLEDRIKLFIDFKNTNAEFEHLVYTGCASISIAGNDLFELFKGNYPDIFKESDNIDNLFKNNETATQLLTVWQETPIMRMDLTSVGIVLAITFYEQITGDKMNIDIWIN